MADVLLAQPPEAPLPSTEVAELVQLVQLESVQLPVPAFDPAIHLNYSPPSTRHSFTELGLPVPRGCHNVCYTEPFQLFSEEGVRMIRREIFNREFLDKYMRSWERAPCLISGHNRAKDVS